MDAMLEKMYTVDTMNICDSEKESTDQIEDDLSVYLDSDSNKTCLKMFDYFIF